jgi:hypothetical protein
LIFETLIISHGEINEDFEMLYILHGDNFRIVEEVHHVQLQGWFVGDINIKCSQKEVGLFALGNLFNLVVFKGERYV